MSRTRRQRRDRARAGLPPLTPAVRLREALEQLAKVEVFGPKYAYRSAYDFVLRHGKEYTPVPLPSRIERGRPRMCFGNALRVAVTMPSLRYVEGYAFGLASIPVLHAWNTDEDGNAIETTWPAGVAYFGVEFSVERADDATWYGDDSVLDDWKRDWPIFREPWAGEKPIPGYKPSPALVAAYKIAAGDTEGAALTWQQALMEARA